MAGSKAIDVSTATVMFVGSFPAGENDEPDDSGSEFTEPWD